MLSIVIPTINEGENLEILLPELKNYSDEIIIVDDGSTDNTIKIGKKNNCKIIERKKKFGVGSAVIDGIRAATGDIVAIVDGDLSHPVKVLKAVSLIEDDLVDIIKFSRFIAGGGMENRLRWWLQLYYIRIINIIAGTRVSDFTSGFLMARKECFNYDSIAVHGEWIIEFMLHNRYRRIAELPYRYACRKFGISKFSGRKDIFRVFRYIYFLFYFRFKQFL